MKNLSEAEAAALARFLASPAQPDDTLTYHALQGFFFALACSPELAQPSEWLPLVFGDQAPNFSGEKGAEAALGRIMKLYNQITHETLRGEAGLPADCRFRDEVLANLEEDAPISQWSNGFLTGHLWLREAWDDYVPKSLEKAFTADVMVLTFFSSRRLAENFVAKIKPRKGKPEPPSLEVVTSRMRDMFPQAVAEYAALGRSIQKVRSLTEEVENLPVRSEKTGRNDPCPCGSGKKYKRCCGAH